MPDERAILHIDMDAFFASVEQHDDPALRGKPVLVGGGVVTSPSYEARPFGCRSAMPMAQARRLCPGAIVVRGRHDRYREVSKQIFGIFEDFTPLVQGLSIDEAFLDVTGSKRLLGDAVSIARTIKQRIREEVGITASVGVATNKFLAKLASDLEKPDGLTIVPEDVATFLAPLPINRMWGVGPVLEQRLHALNIRSFHDLRTIELSVLRRHVGDGAEHLQHLAGGIDDRPVQRGHGVKSISKESTFGRGLQAPADVRRELIRRVEAVAHRLREKHFLARTITVKIRVTSFKTITRSHTFPEATDRTDRLWHAACALLDTWVAKSFAPVRLIGFGVTGLEDDAGRQAELFTDEEERRQRTLDHTADVIRRKFGRDAISRAATYTDES